MSDAELISVKIDDRGIARLTLERPDAKNALSVELMRQLHQATQTLAADDNVRVIVLKGNGGKAFVSGADIS